MPRITVKLKTNLIEDTMVVSFTVIPNYTIDFLKEIINKDLKENVVTPRWAGIEVAEIISVEEVDPEEINIDNWFSSIQPI